MQNSQGTALLLISDAMVCEGMKLLLEDMNFCVISAKSYTSFDGTKLALAIPVLIVISTTQDKDISAFDIIKNIRLDFNQQIPAIFLSYETQASTAADELSDILILPAQIKPGLLRQNISQLLQNTDPEPLSKNTASTKGH
ncbi:MAG: hypothetical protein OEY36_00845 [Gammaproteobacteria bacterium]|nr:hypothetical protein [Gammaproteobacteria bacterium]